VWQNVSGGHTEISILIWIIEKFNWVFIFLFQYIDNDETLEKLCWTRNVFLFVSSSKLIWHENTHTEFCRR